MKLIAFQNKTKMIIVKCLIFTLANIFNQRIFVGETCCYSRVHVPKNPKPMEQDFCCIRNVVFVPIPMPHEQERDATDVISWSWQSALKESKITDCPIEYDEYDWTGFHDLDKLNEDIGKIAVAPSDPVAREAVKKFMFADYIWKGTLTLNRVDHIEQGHWEEGYLGKQNYTPAEAYGDWILHIQLINVHFNEVVKEGNASWTGSIKLDEIDAVKNLARTVFLPVDDIIYDYEHIPWSCEVEPEKDEISIGDKMSITIKNIKDSKGREPKSWQRIVVKVEKGKVINGVKQDKEKTYAFLAENGTVEVKYQAPDDCKDSGTEKITIYNACEWGQEWVHPLRVTNPVKKIGNSEFEISCDWKGTIASTFEMSAQKGQSVVSSILMDGEYNTQENWELDVVFKLDRGNKRVRIYKLKSARINFQEEANAEIYKQREQATLQIDIKDKAEIGGRKLSPSECNLDLFIDLKKKTYKIEGTLEVENIPANGYGRLKVDMDPIHADHQDTDQGITNVSEDILIEGGFSGEELKVMEGSLDIVKECPPEFQEFLKAMAGEIIKKICWNLCKEGS